MKLVMALTNKGNGLERVLDIDISFYKTHLKGYLNIYPHTASPFCFTSRSIKQNKQGDVT